MTSKESKLRKLRKEFEKYQAQGGSDPWGIWCFKGAKFEDLHPVMLKNKEFNQNKFAQMTKHVNGDITNELLNEEYLERARVTKELKQKLKDYTGSDETASDLLFRFKKASDNQGKDFILEANKEIEKMKGKLVVNPEPVDKNNSDIEKKDFWWQLKKDPNKIEDVQSLQDKKSIITTILEFIGIK